MKTKFLALTIFTLLLVFACQTESIDEVNIADEPTILGKRTSSNNSFIVISASNKLPNNINKLISSANGSITSTISEIGLVVVTSDDPDFTKKAAKIKGIQAVVPNLSVQWLNPDEKKASIEADFGNPPVSGDDDEYFDLQWGHDAVDAPEAWDAGYRGAGVRVGVLDTGFDLTHPDLMTNINFALSRDMTGEGLQYSLPDVFSHGTHTAGTIGAADNAFGTIGIAPEAELVLIKVLSDNGNGSFGDIINGIIYAALNDVDVINMSIGITLSRRGGVYDNEGNLLGMASANDISGFVNAVERAVAFAYQSGTTVIASAGNAATDYDHSADLIHLPSDAAHAISISATAPVGWAADPSTNLDVFASTYSNYGQSTIDFAAPGGNYAYAFEPGGFDSCTVGPLTHFCYVFDFVFSTGSLGDWYWSVGTSMAAPHATGVAALIIGKNGGSMKPAQVEAALKRSSDDLGKPGKDDFYGNGRVNAYRAVTE